MAGSKSFSSGVSLYAVADGHNGTLAARAVSASLPAELERQLGAQRDPSEESLRCALARTFLAVDDSVCRTFFQSGEARSRGGAGVEAHSVPAAESGLVRLACALPLTRLARLAPASPQDAR